MKDKGLKKLVEKNNKFVVAGKLISSLIWYSTCTLTMIDQKSAWKDIQNPMRNNLIYMKLMKTSIKNCPCDETGKNSKFGKGCTHARKKTKEQCVFTYNSFSEKGPMVLMLCLWYKKLLIYLVTYYFQKVTPCAAPGGPVYWRDPKDNNRAYLVGIVPRDEMKKVTRQTKGINSNQSVESYYLFTLTI